MLVLIVALAFGLLAALIKGEGGGEGLPELRAVLGNLSVPWLLVGFFAGSRYTTLRFSAFLGLAATTIALIAFYVVSALVQDPSEQGFLDDLRLELSANRGYLQGGLVAGPLFGALGAWWRRTRRVPAALLIGIMLIGEPLVLVAVGALGPDDVFSADSGLPTLVRLLPGWTLTADSGSIRIAVYAAEFVLGAALIVLAVLQSRRRARAKPS
jgi:Family of unknown function (DUF6518)